MIMKKRKNRFTPLVVTLLLSLLFTGCKAGIKENNPNTLLNEMKLYSNDKEIARVATKNSGEKPDLGDASIVQVETYENLLAILKNMGVFYTAEVMNDINDGFYSGSEQRNADNAGGISKETAVAEADTAAPPPEDGGSHSETNTQVKGVDEADVIKNDGTYLYYLNDNVLSIFDTTGSIEAVGTISLQNIQNISISDIYVAGDVLVLNGNRYEYMDKNGKQIDPHAEKQKIASDMMYPVYDKNYTTFMIYDISDRSNPLLTRTVEAEGYAVSTRLIGNHLYFITNKWIPRIAYTEEIPDFSILPSYRDTAVSDTTKTLDISCVSYFPESNDSQYMLVGAFDITKQEEVLPQAYLGSGSTIYMNTNSLYVTKTVYDYDEKAMSKSFAAADTVSSSRNEIGTEIYRFAVSDTALLFIEKAIVPGYIINQYSMDEYNGILRVATGDYNTGNGITTLDINTMKTVGSITGLAVNENIYSVRFMGDTGYMVTYRQVDPLFVFDLSDPANPVQTGELKIPGFSQYLHPVGENYLVGFGRNTAEIYYQDEAGNFIPNGEVRDIGFKLSLFDVSDKTNPKEVFVKNYEPGSHSDASYNPKSIMVDAGNNIFAFPLFNYVFNYGSEKNNYTYMAGGTVVQINPETGFVTLADINTNNHAYNSRFSYIGDKLYYVTNDTIFVYSYPDCELIEKKAY